ncbi:hypothetical protein PBT90_16095 [Algoriphagus halophytocola]|uniref:Uncharacterized protein n=1 Tax=Algoriphagus halophytocola TaxID=2991499 RepID=A0ABY6MEN9_9BACT|nr:MULTISPECIES: hypothetical protein [unclassified Algoriphagus]UZD21091.1 hypothetical protein OM944_10430 [Algoriphagus sp. TR-M5]WBL42257.1 hypothetical protein PBT90_16095 [Algoriphagus sp. TR-M9]
MKRIAFILLILVWILGFEYWEAKASVPDPALVCCLDNPWNDCVVVTFIDPDEGITNQVVVHGVKVDCPYV